MKSFLRFTLPKIYDVTRTVRDVFRTIIWCLCGIELAQYVTLFHFDRNPMHLKHAPNFRYLGRGKIPEVENHPTEKAYSIDKIT